MDGPKNIFSDNVDSEDITIYDNFRHECNYIGINEFQSKFKDTNNQVSFFSQNIHSLPNKWANFQDQITCLNSEKFKFTVIALTEVWYVPEFSNFSIPGYSEFEYKLRPKSLQSHNAGGGVGLWVDSNFSYEVIPDISEILRPLC